MDASNLMSGLVGSLIGAVIGAVVTFVGQKHLMDREVEHRRVGMVKAILGELRHDATVLWQLRLGGKGRSPVFSTDTWEASRFELAQFVPDGVFELLLLIYEDLLPIVEQGLDQMGGPGTNEALAECEEDIKGAMKGLLSLPQAGAFRTQWSIRLTEERSSSAVSEGRGETA